MSAQKEQTPATSENTGLQGYNCIENFEAIEEIMRENLAGERIGMSGLDMIKTPSGGATAWEVQTLNGVENVSEIRGIVIFEKKIRTYWESSFEENGGGEQPDCSSEDLTNGTVRETGALRECATCPFAKYGEDGERQACREGRSLYLLTKDAALPVILRLAPSALRNFRDYKMRLAQALIPLSSAETIVSLEKAKSKKNIAYSKPVFRMGEIVTPEQKGIIARLVKILLAGGISLALPSGNAPAALPEGGKAQKLESDTGI